jgi:hypothetical protein
MTLRVLTRGGGKSRDEQRVARGAARCAYESTRRELRQDFGGGLVPSVSEASQLVGVSQFRRAFDQLIRSVGASAVGQAAWLGLVPEFDGQEDQLVNGVSVTTGCKVTKLIQFGAGSSVLPCMISRGPVRRHGPRRATGTAETAHWARSPRRVNIAL